MMQIEPIQRYLILRNLVTEIASSMIREREFRGIRILCLSIFFSVVRRDASLLQRWLSVIYRSQCPVLSYTKGSSEPSGGPTSITRDGNRNSPASDIVHFLWRVKHV